MSVTWNRDLERMQTYIKGYPQRLKDEAAQVVSEAVDEGEQLMVKYINTRGLGGKQGRIDTGLMKDSVSKTDAVRTVNGAEASFGWGLDSQTEDYFLYQEYGFTHRSRVSGFESRGDVPPMHALMDAFVVVREKMFDRIKKAVGR